MKRTSLMIGVLCGALGCGAVQDVNVQEPSVSATDDEDDDGEDEDENEEVVALDQIPEAVKKAAAAAVPGFVVSGAEKETEEGSLHYCVHGTAAGEFVEVEVTPDGQVLEIERGEDDEDE